MSYSGTFLSFFLPCWAVLSLDEEPLILVPRKKKEKKRRRIVLVPVPHIIENPSLVLPPKPAELVDVNPITC